MPNALIVGAGQAGAQWFGGRGGYRRQHRVTRDGAGGYVEEERGDSTP